MRARHKTSVTDCLSSSRLCTGKEKFKQSHDCIQLSKYVLGRPNLDLFDSHYFLAFGGLLSNPEDEISYSGWLTLFLQNKGPQMKG